MLLSFCGRDLKGDRMKFSSTLILDDREKTIELLEKCDNFYHTNGKMLISDTEYDALKTKAKKLYGDDVYFTTIGAPVNGKSDKVTLPYIMGSLDKLKQDTVEKWLDKKGSVVISDKLDGASVIVTWKNGEVVFAATRGDGETGQDITEKAKVFCSSIPVKESVTLRGELLLTGDDHITLGLKNRRNGVVGVFNNDNPNISALKMIKPRFYEYVSGPVDIPNEIERMNYISNVLLLDTPNYGLISNTDVEYLTALLFSNKAKAGYDIDGLVLTVDDSKRENVLLPKNKVSFKVNEDAVKVKVTGIEWNTTRMGRIVPVVLVEATDISGSTIRRATGFNAKYIYDNGIDVGAVIGLVKSGEVIPYITEVFKKSDLFRFDNLACPSCFGELQWKGVDLVCNNINCNKIKIKSIAHFFKTIGSEYMSEKTIEKLNVFSIEDMYELNELDITLLDGFGIKKAGQVVYEIQKTLKTEPHKLLAAFGIDGIGKRISKEILTQFTMDELFDSIDTDKLSTVLGPKTMDKFLANINNFKQLYNFLKDKGLEFKINGGVKMLDGKKFALTGKAPVKRDLIVSLIEKNGGSVATMSKTTNYLATSDVDSMSGKTKKALEYGTKIISYEELFGLMGEEI